jgi:hypothetical protein
MAEPPLQGFGQPRVQIGLLDVVVVTDSGGRHWLIRKQLLLDLGQLPGVLVQVLVGLVDLLFESDKPDYVFALSADLRACQFSEVPCVGIGWVGVLAAHTHLEAFVDDLHDAPSLILEDGGYVVVGEAHLHPLLCV